MSYDSYQYTFDIPDGRMIRGAIYGTYYPRTYDNPPDFEPKETDCLVLVWEDGTDLTETEYEMELYFKDSDYRCELQQYAIDMIYDFGKFEYGDPVEYEFDMDVEYVAIGKLFSNGYHIQK